MAKNGKEAVEKVSVQDFDLVFMDVQMQVMNGFEATEEIRKMATKQSLIIIGLSANAFEDDQKKALEVGMDDYLTKPFSPKELVLRVNAILKRTDAPPGAVEYDFGPFRFDKNAVRFYLDNEPVDLTGTEFKLLLFLCERSGKPQDRNELLRTVWGYSDEVHSRTLDTHMKRLRQKLGTHGALIETVRGVGYCVSSPVT